MAQRVVVWGTGNVGKAALRAVIADPALELAGVIVSQAAKVGRDAGELADLPPVGVAASDDVAGVLAKGVDAVAYAPRGTSVRTRRSTTSSARSAPGAASSRRRSIPSTTRRRRPRISVAGWRTPVLPAARRSS